MTSLFSRPQWWFNSSTPLLSLSAVISVTRLSRIIKRFCFLPDNIRVSFINRRLCLLNLGVVTIRRLPGSEAQQWHDFNYTVLMNYEALRVVSLPINYNAYLMSGSAGSPCTRPQAPRGIELQSEGGRVPVGSQKRLFVKTFPCFLL